MNKTKIKLKIKYTIYTIYTIIYNIYNIYNIYIIIHIISIIISSVWKDNVYNYLSVEKSKQVSTIAELVAAPLGHAARKYDHTAKHSNCSNCDAAT